MESVPSNSVNLTTDDNISNISLVVRPIAELWFRFRVTLTHWSAPYWQSCCHFSFPYTLSLRYSAGNLSFFYNKIQYALSWPLRIEAQVWEMGATDIGFDDPGGGFTGSRSSLSLTVSWHKHQVFVFRSLYEWPFRTPELRVGGHNLSRNEGDKAITLFSRFDCPDVGWILIGSPESVWEQCVGRSKVLLCHRQRRDNLPVRLSISVLIYVLIFEWIYFGGQIGLILTSTAYVCISF